MNSIKRIMTAALMLTSIGAMAQNITFRAGESILLYDHRYYNELFGPKSPRIPSFNLKLGWQDDGSSPYASICNYPEYGIAFNVDCLGTATAANGPGVGSLYSVYGFFDRPIFTVRDFSLCYTAGLGIGCCFNNLYDSLENPWNIMISFPVNAHITLGIQTKTTISDKYIAGVGVFFNHYSNGAVNFQNKGYNGFEFGLSVGMKDFTGKQKQAGRESAGGMEPSLKDDGFRKGFVYDIHASAGVMSVEAVFDNTLAQTGVGQNIRKLKYSLHGDVLYKYCRTHASGIGVDLFVTPFCDLIAENDNKGRTYEPVSLGVCALHELNYRNLTAMVGLGRYLYDNDGLAHGKKLYQMVNIRYHLNQYEGLYAGIVLKAHKFMAAESIQLCLGHRF